MGTVAELAHATCRMNVSPVPKISAGSAEDGLSAADAAERLTRDGRNELPQERRRGILHIIVGSLREPMV